MLEMDIDGTFVPVEDHTVQGAGQGQGAVGGQQPQAQEGEGKTPAAHGAQQHQPAPVDQLDTIESFEITEFNSIC